MHNILIKKYTEMIKEVLLEYKAEYGQWHCNIVDNGTPHHAPNTNGWDAIAYTTDEKARVFTNMMDCKLHRRAAKELSPYTTEHVKKEWKLFCYIFNDIIRNVKISPEYKELVEEKYDSAVALARLGNSHFSDLKADEELDWAWEYDPMSFLDSNI